MRTIQILLQLIHSIKSNPAVAALLPWSDILLCVSEELACRTELYSETQFQQVSGLFTELLEEARAEAAAYNPDAVLSRLQKLVFALSVLPETAYADALIEQAHFDHACLRHYREDTVIVLGDSHVNFFSGSDELSFLPIGKSINTCPDNPAYPFTPLHAGPCLAYTCCQSGTTYSFREKAEYVLKNFIKSGARILCCLGEIDLRVHVFKQAALQGKSYKEIVDDILAKSLPFLLYLQSQGYRVSCWGPIASQKESCPLNPKFPRNGSEKERNLATAYFNQRLSEMCGEHGILFLSVFDKMISPNFETLEQYLSSDGCHLGQNALSIALPEWQKLF